MELVVSLTCLPLGLKDRAIITPPWERELFTFSIPHTAEVTINLHIVNYEM